MTYRALDIDRQPDLLEAFLQLPFQVYRDDPHWVAPFTEQVRSRLGSSHPFAGFLEQRHFLVVKGGTPVARCSAYINHMVQIEGKPLGTLGQFESFDNPEAVRVLSERACTWLADKGVSTIWGPMDGSLWLNYRLMTKGFGDMPYYGEPYNAAYYPRLFEAMGFQPFKAWQSTYAMGEGIKAMADKTKPRYEKALELGYRFRTLDIKRFDDELKLLYRLVSLSFAGFTGFHPIGESDFLDLFGGIKAIADPRLVYFAHDPHGQVVGYSCVLPDLAPAVRQMRGQTHLWAKLRFFAARRPQAHIALYLGITPEEQAKRTGTGGALAHLTTSTAYASGLPLISALMAEGSFAASYSKDTTGRTHRYALYQRSL